MLDYDGIKALSKKLGRPASTLIALAHTNDPFYITETRRAAAEWFADLWKEFKMVKGGHIRGLHYRIISQRTPVLMRNGMPYKNTAACWHDLAVASKDARYLHLVPVDDFVDRRNAEAITNIRSTGDPMLYVGSGDLTMDEMPDLPYASLEVGERTQRYQIEIWVEKTTMNDIIEPIAERYGVTLITGTGEESTTHCNQCLARAKENRRPVRILYISDFDPGGQSMPVAVARKIEFLLRDSGLDLDIQLHPIVLNPEQCQRYALPKTFIKKKERRAKRYEERFGEGATELDALEALHPGELARIIEDEIARYYDHGLDAKTRVMAESIHAELERVTAQVHDRHGREIASLRSEYDTIPAAHARWAKRANPVWHAIENEVEAAASSIIDEIEWPEQEEGDENRDPLFDSTRDYVEQIDRYKRFQDKPTTRRVKAT